MGWIHFSMLFHYLCQMKLYMPAGDATLCQSWATTPVPVYPYQGRTKCHGNRCVLTSLALSNRRGSMDSQLFKRGKSLASHLLLSQHTWSAEGEFGGGSDWDSDKTPAFISSSASQELFDCAISAICACVIQPSPSVSAAGLCLSVPLLFRLFLAVTSYACIFVWFIGEQRWCYNAGGMSVTEVTAE